LKISRNPPRDLIHACISSESLMYSRNVMPVFKSTTSSRLGWVNTAKVVLATAFPAFGPRTKYGTAFNAPPVICFQSRTCLKCKTIDWNIDFHNL
jgi:hypothetical protein